jgi:hypothetical protein
MKCSLASLVQRLPIRVNQRIAPDVNARELCEHPDSILRRSRIPPADHGDCRPRTKKEALLLPKLAFDPRLEPVSGNVDVRVLVRLGISICKKKKKTVQYKISKSDTRSYDLNGPVTCSLHWITYCTTMSAGRTMAGTHEV